MVVSTLRYFADMGKARLKTTLATLTRRGTHRLTFLVVTRAVCP